MDGLSEVVRYLQTVSSLWTGRFERVCTRGRKATAECATRVAH
jgi:hypothetical protein